MPLETKCWRVVTAVIIAIYLTIMVVTPLHLHYQLVTTFSRLTLHLFPLAMLIMAEQVIASGWRELSEGNLRIKRPLALPLRAAALLLAAGPVVAATFWQ